MDRDTREVVQDLRFAPPSGFGAECLGVYYPRLLRDVWSIEMQVGPLRVSSCTVFTKPLPYGWLLRKFAFADTIHPQGSGCYWDEHELENPALRLLLQKPGWEWAERDGPALLWADKGCLYRAQVEPRGLGRATKLYDFNDMRFERRTAPY